MTDWLTAMSKHFNFKVHVSQSLLWIIDLSETAITAYATETGLNWPHWPNILVFCTYSYHIRVIPVSWSCHRNHLLLVVTIPLNYCCNTLPRILKNTTSTSLYYSVHIIKYNNGQINKLNIVSVLIQMDDEVSRCNTESCMEWLLHTSNYLQYLYITIVSPQVAIFSNPGIVRLKS